MRTSGVLARTSAQLALLVLLGACAVEEERREAELSAALELPEGSLFSVDTTTERMAVPAAGAPDVSVVGVLADRQGRRSLQVEGGRWDGELVRPAGWVVLSAAASSNGLLAVCWSELVGSPSTLTQGALPDPTDGVDLLCRFRSAAGWTAAQDVAPGAPAAWVQGLTASEEGFEVQYRRDSGLLLVDTAPEDGSYLRSIAPGQEPGPHRRAEPASGGGLPAETP